MADHDGRPDHGHGGHRRPGRGGERPRGGHKGPGGKHPRSVTRPSERSRQADPAREAAFATLRAVSASGAYANLALPAELRRRHLSGANAAFAIELTYGTLRLRGRYDAVIALTSTIPPDQLDPELLDVIRLGMHQLFAMRVPDHAAVNETVALARSTIGDGPSRLVNAVLRQALTRSLGEWLDEACAGLEPGSPASLAVRESEPEWIVRALGAALVVHGRERADNPGLLAAINDNPVVTLAARPGLITPADLAVQAAGLQEDPVAPGPGQPASDHGARPPGAGGPPLRLSPIAVPLAAGDPARLPAIGGQLAHVQDEASQFVALALALAPLDGRDERWLDMCAGPGGKAALLAALARQRGATLVANELQPHRAKLVRDALGPLGDVTDVRCADGRLIGENEPGSYDRILLDAPCTGLGALRRRPEARWRKQPGDLPALTALQRDLLSSAMMALRPGGLLAYVTCSPHPAETEAIVAGAMKARPGFTLLSAAQAGDAVWRGGRDASQLPAAPGGARPYAPQTYATSAGTIATWPDTHGTDAMFCALLQAPA